MDQYTFTLRKDGGTVKHFSGEAADVALIARAALAQIAPLRGDEPDAEGEFAVELLDADGRNLIGGARTIAAMARAALDEIAPRPKPGRKPKTAETAIEDVPLPGFIEPTEAS